MKRLFLLGLLFIVACTSAPAGPQTTEERFFAGSEGVTVDFVDADSPPRTLYYYADTNDNTFDITVDVFNKGSSLTRGALYLSGYDPNLINVKGINPDLTSSAFGACGFGIGNIGYGSWGFEVICDSVGLAVGEGGGRFSANDILNTIGNLLGQQGWDENRLLSNLQVALDWTEENAYGTLGITIGGVDLDLEYGYRGKLLIALFSAINFGPFDVEYILAGDTPDFPGGDLAVVDWDANIVNWPAGLDETQQSFLVTNCYLYTTHAAPVVCIDPSPYTETNKVCRPSNVDNREGQGAPVAVTKITQENTPRQSVFTIHVKNIGTGTVWDPGMIHKCNPYQQTRVSTADKNKVWLGHIRVSGDPAELDCVPNDFIRLDRDTQEGIITCRYDIPFQGLKSAYQTPLIVELWYGYEESIKKSVIIKRAI